MDISIVPRYLLPSDGNSCILGKISILVGRLVVLVHHDDLRARLGVAHARDEVADEAQRRRAEHELVQDQEEGLPTRAKARAQEDQRTPAEGG